PNPALRRPAPQSSLVPSDRTVIRLEGGFVHGGNGHTVARAPVLGDEAVPTSGRRSSRSGRAPRSSSKGSRSRSRRAPDAARRRAHDLVSDGHALWLRRVHPARGLARDASDLHANPALALRRTDERGELPLSRRQCVCTALLSTRVPFRT